MRHIITYEKFDVMSTGVCNICGEEKNIIEFNRYKKTQRLKAKCVSCERMGWKIYNSKYKNKSRA